MRGRDTDVSPVEQGGSIERKCCTCRNSADTLLSRSFDRIRPGVKGSLSARWGNDNGDGIDLRTSFHSASARWLI